MISFELGLSEQEPDMGFKLFLFFILIFITNPKWVCGNAELGALMDIKAGLDPKSFYLSSWAVNRDPCDGSFEGIA